MDDSKELTGKQSLKNQRVRSYFVQAAKKIILDEGVENVSVRKVADLAGYTFSTIYNYYNTLNELLQDVKADMISDLIVHMQKTLPKKLFDLDDIKKQNRLYVKYFIDNPNVFSFFYSYRLHPIEKDRAEVPDFSMQYLETYRGFVESGVITESEVAALAKTFIYSLQGLLALYFSDNGMSIEMLYEELDQLADFLLRKRGAL
ncbi:MAG: TetR/AcrR family transcriptional regulator [Clostridiales bacterium]|nr:TetR/AcrR family transcriptional regulator [Clostridiales bacterium]